MDRLTNRLTDGTPYVRSETGTEGVGHFTTQRRLPEVIALLAAYEDTGLTPEICAAYKAFEDEAISKGVTFNRIVELMEAERTGRLVVLPCKVDDTVFVQLVGRIFPFDVISINIHGKTPTFKAQHGIHLVWVFGVDDIGKTVFLTREEAERALEVQK